jgi:hypothetical protein
MIRYCEILTFFAGLTGGQTIPHGFASVERVDCAGKRNKRRELQGRPADMSGAGVDDGDLACPMFCTSEELV